MRNCHHPKTHHHPALGQKYTYVSFWLFVCLSTVMSEIAILNQGSLYMAVY